jgi:hypothetical protein
MTPEQEIEIADEAKRLLEHPIIRMLLADEQAKWIDAWKISPARDAAGRAAEPVRQFHRPRQGTHGAGGPTRWVPILGVPGGVPIRARPDQRSSDGAQMRLAET